MFKSYRECPNPDIYFILHDFYMLIYKKKKRSLKGTKRVIRSCKSKKDKQYNGQR